MDIYRLKDLSQADRRAVLDSEAATITEQDYMRPLADEELAALKSDLAQACVQKGFIDNEFSDVKADFKARLKPINSSINTAIMCLTSRMKNEQGKVYMVPDHDHNMMHSVTEQGDVLNSRPMRPEERQLRLSHGEVRSAV